MKKRYILFIIIFLIIMVIFLITRAKVISRNEKLILSDDFTQYELLEKIINNEFGSIEEYNILLDNSFYYNFITNKEYSNEVKDKIKILERINMGVEKNYTLSLEYYNNCLTIANEIKEDKEKHTLRFYLDVAEDKITYKKGSTSLSEYK